VKVALFDAYVMVDWSGGDGRRGGGRDCIWIACGHRTAREAATASPRSRTEAERAIRSALLPFTRPGAGRVLVGADFAYGYPAGFASLLPGAGASSLPPWRSVWRYLRDHLKDDLGARPGRAPTNRSNRFDVASAINAAASTGGPAGPFWCLPRAGSRPCIPQRRPRQPYPLARGGLPPLRITDGRAGSDTPFRLFGTGSVGSQALTGIPRLARLRDDPLLSRSSAAWPFETGWATDGPWLPAAVKILHAEIYPSVRAPLRDAVKDRGQVRAMWRWARDLDAEELLVAELAIPEGIRRGSPEDEAIRAEEGWILGCPPARSLSSRAAGAAPTRRGSMPHAGPPSTPRTRGRGRGPSPGRERRRRSARARRPPWPRPSASRRRDRWRR
jgi:precorrin-8X/cobalt-precorrin-8 methylmutase